MPPRLAHSKSRTGCQRCKARKVKCDEHRPVCLNCRRHNVECQYSTKGLSSMSPASACHELDLENSMTHDQRRVLELQLLHCFSTTVVWTLGSASDPCAREIWQYTAIELAFEYPFLRTAIFTFAALYLIKVTPTSRCYFAPPDEAGTASRAMNRPLSIRSHLPLSTIYGLYLDLGIRQQHEAIESVNPESANALFLSSVLYWYQAAPQFSIDISPRNYSPPVHWLRMAKANGTTADVAMDLMPDRHVVAQIASDDDPSWRNQDALYNMRNCKPFMALLDWETYPELEPFSTDTKEVYEAFLAYVGSIYKALQACEPQRTLFRRFVCLGAMLPIEVAQLVEERRPRALAILANYFAMAYSLDNHWMWHGLADREVNGIQSIMPPEWMWAMDWSKDMLQSLKSKQFPTPV